MGEPALGQGAVITWALLDKASRYPDALNCRAMVPLFAAPDTLARQGRLCVEEPAPTPSTAGRRRPTYEFTHDR
jgi:hypothetical protein